MERGSSSIGGFLFLHHLHQQSSFKVLKFSTVFDSFHQVKDISWLPGSLSPHCKLIVSTVSSSLSYKSLCARPDVRTVELVSAVDKEAQLHIFREYLSFTSRDPFRQSRYSLRKKTNLSPLKLTILANEYQECRIYRNEFQCLKEYLGVASIQELWALILKRWVEDYSWTLKQKKANSDTVASGEGRHKAVLTTWSESTGRKIPPHPPTPTPHLPSSPGRKVEGEDCQRKYSLPSLI